MDDLIAFLNARWDEALARATVMKDAVWPTEVHVNPTGVETGVAEERASIWVAPQYTKRYLGLWCQSNKTDGFHGHLDDRWSVPSAAFEVWSANVADQVVADVESKRRIIDLCAYLLETRQVQEAKEELTDYSLGRAHAGESILRLLAQPYVGHPDFREEWRTA